MALKARLDDPVGRKGRPRPLSDELRARGHLGEGDALARDLLALRLGQFRQGPLRKDRTEQALIRPVASL